ncbi:MAG: adenine deaminase [Candidatus Tectomicrobia bacterium]|uniref:Adenine deaminase n=1 Tax=Tectimicrobiota bacterium TaxID=2528274 RepID=A0A932M0W0_UNCTE|nr:adenine deaminase [Candidatus Tectomicrobia bacterium]
MAAENTDKRKLTVRVAMGQHPADLVVRGGTLINVYTGELQEDTSVAIMGDTIAAVGQGIPVSIGPETLVLEAKGKFLSPGFLDVHTHILNIFRIAEYVRWAAPRGNTCVITETLELANAVGRRGVEAFLEEIRDQPIEIFALAPAKVPTYPEFERGAPFALEDHRHLLAHERVLGVGETNWPLVTGLDETSFQILELGSRAGKFLQGHGAGARGEKLQAYAAAGITSCHEPIALPEILERLRLGIYTMVRQGGVRRDLEALKGIETLRRLVLVSDGISPESLVEGTDITGCVQKAIALGIPPIQAIQTVTLNAAESMGLSNRGGIAPGKIADLLILEDLNSLRCQTVICRGKIIARDGKLLEPAPMNLYPSWIYHSLNLPETHPADFRIPFAGTRAAVRVVHIAGDMLTKEDRAEISGKNGELHAIPEEDLLKVAVINRYDHPGEKFVGFVKGYGLRRGAAANSFSWVTNNVVVVGANDQDMALAVNRLRELQGGVVFCSGGKVVKEIAFPLAGIISEEPMDALARKILDLEDAQRREGSTLRSPFLTLQTLPFTGVPFLRPTDLGLVDVRARKFVDLIYQ